MKKICIVLSMCMMFMLGACCVQEVGAEQNNSNFPINYLESSGYYRVRQLTDNETGVNYLLVWEKGHGNIAITPRLNADGTLYVTGGK